MAAELPPNGFSNNESNTEQSHSDESKKKRSSSDTLNKKSRRKEPRGRTVKVKKERYAELSPERMHELDRGRCRMSNTYESLKRMQDQAPCLFSHAGEMPQPEEPLFILLVGCPGVGKTSSAQTIIQSKLDMHYREFYHVSLDTLLERVEPYKRHTRNKMEEKEDDPNSKLDALFGISSRFFQSKRNTFKSSKNTYNNHENDQSYQSLLDLTDEGLVYGIQKGFNIIYDTTLSKKGDKIKNMIELIQVLSPKPYHVVILYVTAEEEQIKKQLNQRHQAMQNQNKAIRAVPPSKVKHFIRDHDEGMEAGIQLIEPILADSDKILSVRSIVYHNTKIENGPWKQGFNANVNTNNSLYRKA
jgi:GTPase SAR1 family protein